MSICTLGVAILGFAWISVTTSSQIIVFCILYGFFSGAFMALLIAVVAATTPNLKQLGLRIGLFMLPASIGVLIGNPIAGTLSKHGWLGLQAFCGSALMASCISLIVARVWKTGAKVLVKI